MLASSSIHRYLHSVFWRFTHVRMLAVGSCFAYMVLCSIPAYLRRSEIVSPYMHTCVVPRVCVYPLPPLLHCAAGPFPPKLSFVRVSWARSSSSRARSRQVLFPALALESSNRFRPLAGVSVPSRWVPPVACSSPFREANAPPCLASA